MHCDVKKLRTVEELASARKEAQDAQAGSEGEHWSGQLDSCEEQHHLVACVEDEDASETRPCVTHVSTKTIEDISSDDKPLFLTVRPSSRSAKVHIKDKIKLALREADDAKGHSGDGEAPCPGRKVTHMHVDAGVSTKGSVWEPQRQSRSVRYRSEPRVPPAVPILNRGTILTECGGTRCPSAKLVALQHPDMVCSCEKYRESQTRGSSRDVATELQRVEASMMRVASSSHSPSSKLPLHADEESASVRKSGGVKDVSEHVRERQEDDLVDD